LKELYVLYVLYVGRYIKIGITSYDRKDIRFKEIEKAFGKINKNKSFYYTSPSFKTIKNIEKALHYIFYEKQKTVGNAGGSTEFFQKSIQTNLKNILKTIQKNNKLDLEFFKEKNENRLFLLSFFFSIIAYILIDMFFLNKS